MAVLKWFRQLVAFLVLAVCASAAGADSANEYQVKAAFLYNFLKFVEFPDAGDGPWILGIVGRNPFGDQLEETVRGKLVNGRPIAIRHFAHITDVEKCHVLFIPRAEFAKAATVARPGTLIVGESPGFLEAGGTINFYLEGNRVRFEIRAEAAHANGLHIGAQLLKLGSRQ